MAAAEVAKGCYGWQSPRISFGMDANAENGWQSPRISFSLDLAVSDRVSPDKRPNSGAADADDSSEFEFCVVSACAPSDSEAQKHILVSADELFGGGKILPLIAEPPSTTSTTTATTTTTTEKIECQAHEKDHESSASSNSGRSISSAAVAPVITIARHLSLEGSCKARSPVRSSSYPPSKSATNKVCDKNNAPKGSVQRSQSKWKDMFRLSSKEHSSSVQSSSSSSSSSSHQRSLWPFSRSCSSGSGESRFGGNALFCSLPFTRSYSTAERSKQKTCYRSSSVGSQSRDMHLDALSSLVMNSSLEISEEPRHPPPPPPAIVDACQGRAVRHKSKTYCARSRNIDRCSARAALASPLPGRPIMEGSGIAFSQKKKKNTSSISGCSSKGKSRSGFAGSVGINPVLNVPVCMSAAGAKSGSGLFVFRTFFSSRTDKNLRASKKNSLHV